MKILITAATKEEISLLNGIKSINHELDFLITGVGMVATAYSLTGHLKNNHYDLAINCGIAGSFDRSIQIGEVVSVKEDIFSELGAEDGNDFLSLDQIGLQGKNYFKNTFLLNAVSMSILREVRSITVNTIHGNDPAIKIVVNRFQPHIETMEGASFFFVCENENIPSLQLRSISNYIEKRNRESWNIPLAIENLNNTLTKVISSL